MTAETRVTEPSTSSGSRPCAFLGLPPGWGPAASRWFSAATAPPRHGLAAGAPTGARPRRPHHGGNPRRPHPVDRVVHGAGTDRAGDGHRRSPRGRMGARSPPQLGRRQARRRSVLAPSAQDRRRAFRRHPVGRHCEHRLAGGRPRAPAGSGNRHTRPPARAPPGQSTAAARGVVADGRPRPRPSRGTGGLRPAGHRPHVLPCRAHLDGPQARRRQGAPWNRRIRGGRGPSPR